MRIALVAAFVAALTTAPAAHAAPAIEDLGTLPGHLRSTASDINEFGSAAGVSYGTGTTQRAVRWDRHGGISALADLGLDTWAAAINREATVVGYTVTPANLTQAARWDSSNALTPLNVPGATASVAYDVNDSGITAGTATINGVSHVVVWDRAGVATVFGEGSARFISNSGWVFGSVGNQPARWTSGGSLYVFDNAGAVLRGYNEAADAAGVLGSEGVLWLCRRRAPLGQNTTAADISNTGWAVGTANSRAVRWEAGEFTTGQPFAPAPSTAVRLNDAGLVAGTVGSSAATWTATNTQTTLPTLPGAITTRPTGLAENGQVIGVVTFADNTYRAVVWR